MEIGGDVFDIRDAIARFEELEGQTETLDADEQEEFAALKQLLEETAGNGGDEKWRGHWYPVTFIADHHFESYAYELAEDIHGKAIREAQWPFDCIDWGKAADALQMDYSSVEFNDTTYWYR